MAAQASANDSVLLKSEDGGATWHPTSLTLAGFILSVAVNPTDEREIYTGTTDGVRKSIDGGSTWVSLSVPSVNPVLALALDPQNPDIVFAAQGGVLGRSVDAGEQWEVLPTPSEPYSWLVRALAVDPLRPHRLFAAPQSHGVKEISIAPDLAIAMSPSSLHEPLATPNAFTIEVTNEGPFDATNVTTTIVLTGALSEIEANVSGGSCASTANSVTCTHPVLRRDVSREILLNLTYSQAGGATIAAIVEGDQPDPVENNNSTELSFEVVELADLNVDLSGATALTEGETATYTATVRNEGPNVATNVSVQLQFASAVAIATAVPSKGTCAAVVGGRIECTIPSLSPDESATVSFVTRALPMGTHTSTVSVSASGIDPVSHNSDSSISTLVSSLPAPEIPPPSTETPPPEEVPPPPTEPPPSTDSPPPTAGTPPSRSAGGGGGGGSSSGLLLGLLAAFASLRRKAGMRRDGGVPGLNV